jgi:hypothetical protein
MRELIYSFYLYRANIDVRPKRGYSRYVYICCLVRDASDDDITVRPDLVSQGGLSASTMPGMEQDADEKSRADAIIKVAVDWPQLVGLNIGVGM